MLIGKTKVNTKTRRGRYTRNNNSNKGEHYKEGDTRGTKNSRRRTERRRGWK